MTEEHKLGELIDQYLSGEISEEALVELAAKIEKSPDARRLFWERAEERALLFGAFCEAEGMSAAKEQMEEDLGAVCPQPAAAAEGAALHVWERAGDHGRHGPGMKKQPRPLHRIIWGAAAACAVLVAGSYFFSLWREEQARHRMFGRLASVIPIVSVERDGRRLEARAGMVLRAGDIVRTEEGGAARIRYTGEKTAFELSDWGAAELWDEDGAKRVDFKRGTVRCAVASQPEGKTMVMFTPHARAEVLGTRFQIAIRPGATWLEVTEGLVRFTRKFDGSVIEVAAGENAEAASGLQLAAQSVLEAARVRENVVRGMPAPPVAILGDAKVNAAVRSSAMEQENLKQRSLRTVALLKMLAEELMVNRLGEPRVAKQLVDTTATLETVGEKYMGDAVEKLKEFIVEAEQAARLGKIEDVSRLQEEILKMLKAIRSARAAASRARLRRQLLAASKDQHKAIKQTRELLTDKDRRVPIGKNPENLSREQKKRLADVAETQRAARDSLKQALANLKEVARGREAEEQEIARTSREVADFLEKNEAQSRSDDVVDAIEENKTVAALKKQQEVKDLLESALARANGKLADETPSQKMSELFNAKEELGELAAKQKDLTAETQGVPKDAGPESMKLQEAKQDQLARGTGKVAEKMDEESLSRKAADMGREAMERAESALAEGKKDEAVWNQKLAETALETARMALDQEMDRLARSEDPLEKHRAENDMSESQLADALDKEAAQVAQARKDLEEMMDGQKGLKQATEKLAESETGERDPAAEAAGAMQKAGENMEKAARDMAQQAKGAQDPGEKSAMERAAEEMQSAAEGMKEAGAQMAREQSPAEGLDKAGEAMQKAGEAMQKAGEAMQQAAQKQSDPQAGQNVEKAAAQMSESAEAMKQAAQNSQEAFMPLQQAAQAMQRAGEQMEQSAKAKQAGQNMQKAAQAMKEAGQNMAGASQLAQAQKELGERAEQMGKQLPGQTPASDQPMMQAAQNSMQQVARNMQQAAGRLGEQPKSAIPNQQKAMGSMQQAMEQLASMERALQQQADAARLRAMSDSLTAMASKESALAAQAGQPQPGAEQMQNMQSRQQALQDQLASMMQQSSQQQSGQPSQQGQQSMQQAQKSMQQAQKSMQQAQSPQQGSPTPSQSMAQAQSQMMAAQQAMQQAVSSMQTQASQMQSSANQSSQSMQASQQASMQEGDPNAPENKAEGQESQTLDGRGNQSAASRTADLKAKQTGKDWTAKFSERERVKFGQDADRALPPQYSGLVEGYYRRLAREGAGLGRK